MIFSWRVLSSLRRPKPESLDPLGMRKGWVTLTLTALATSCTLVEILAGERTRLAWRLVMGEDPRWSESHFEHLSEHLSSQCRTSKRRLSHEWARAKTVKHAQGCIMVKAQSLPPNVFWFSMWFLICKTFIPEKSHWIWAVASSLALGWAWQRWMLPKFDFASFSKQTISLLYRDIYLFVAYICRAPSSSMVARSYLRLFLWTYQNSASEFVYRKRLETCTRCFTTLPMYTASHSRRKRSQQRPKSGGKYGRFRHIQTNSCTQIMRLSHVLSLHSVQTSDWQACVAPPHQPLA